MVFLWRIATDGSNLRQLTTEGVGVRSVAYSPKAGLVFTQLEGGDDVVAHIWRMDPDGGGLRQLTDGSGDQMAGLSPAGATVMFFRWREPGSLWVLKLDDGGPRKIVDGTMRGQAVISPDGTRVLSVTAEDISGREFPRHNIIPAEGGAPIASFRLPPDAANVQWTPDGRALTYVDQGQGWNLMRKPLPDGESERLTHFTDGRVVGHAWSRDGSRMVIHRRVGKHHTLWMLKPGQTRPTLIAEFKTGWVRSYFWAPDEPILHFIHGSSSQDVVMITGIN
jgi:Tol biopolymer transport system component